MVQGEAASLPHLVWIQERPVLGGLLQLLRTLRICLPGDNRHPHVAARVCEPAATAFARTLTSEGWPRSSARGTPSPNPILGTPVHNERIRAADYAFFDVSFTDFAHRGGATYEPNLFARTACTHSRSMASQSRRVTLGYRTRRRWPALFMPNTPRNCPHSGCSGSVFPCMQGNRLAKSVTGSRPPSWAYEFDSRQPLH